MNWEIKGSLALPALTSRMALFSSASSLGIRDLVICT